MWPREPLGHVLGENPGEVILSGLGLPTTLESAPQLHTPSPGVESRGPACRGESQQAHLCPCTGKGLQPGPGPGPPRGPVPAGVCPRMGVAGPGQTPGPHCAVGAHLPYPGPLRERDPSTSLSKLEL